MRPHPPDAAIAERDRFFDGRSAKSRRYLQPGFGRLRCNRRGCFVCISCVLDALSEQCLRRNPRTYLLVAAIFRTNRLLHKRCAVTCLRRRRPGQVRRRQGRLQITADLDAKFTAVLAVSTMSRTGITAAQPARRRPLAGWCLPEHHRGLRGSPACLVHQLPLLARAERDLRRPLGSRRYDRSRQQT